MVLRSAHVAVVCVSGTSETWLRSVDYSKTSQPLQKLAQLVHVATMDGMTPPPGDKLGSLRCFQEMSGQLFEWKMCCRTPHRRALQLKAGLHCSMSPLPLSKFIFQCDLFSCMAEANFSLVPSSICFARWMNLRARLTAPWHTCTTGTSTSS